MSNILLNVSAQLSKVSVEICSSTYLFPTFLGNNHSEVILFSSLYLSHKSKYGLNGFTNVYTISCFPLDPLPLVVIVSGVLYNEP